MHTATTARCLPEGDIGVNLRLGQEIVHEHFGLGIFGGAVYGKRSVGHIYVFFFFIGTSEQLFESMFLTFSQTAARVKSLEDIELSEVFEAYHAEENIDEYLSWRRYCRASLGAPSLWQFGSTEDFEHVRLGDFTGDFLKSR